MMPTCATSHLKFSNRKFPYLKKPSMLRFIQTLAISQRCLVSSLRFADLPPELKIHRGCGKEERGERRIPRAVKNSWRRPGDFSAPATREAPVPPKTREKNDEGERIKKHGES